MRIPKRSVVLNHEWDIRDALGIDSDRKTASVKTALTAAVGLSNARRQMTGEASIAVEVSDTNEVLGDPKASVRIRGLEFELLRAFSGRRTAAQVEQFECIDTDNPYDIVNPWTEPAQPLTW